MFYIKKLQIHRLTRKVKTYSRNRHATQASAEMVRREIACYHKLAELYLSLEGNKKYPHAKILALACYRAAATLEDADARYLLGRELLNEAKCRAELQASEVFAHSVNERDMNQRFDEAHAYLQSAEQLQHILAKRLRGLAYINGWGVEVDKKKGFDLILASIEQENSWAKVPQIFASMGLNKPEFYSALTEYRHKV